MAFVSLAFYQIVSTSISFQVSLLKYHFKVVNKVFRTSIELVISHVVRETVPLGTEFQAGLLYFQLILTVAPVMDIYPDVSSVEREEMQSQVIYPRCLLKKSDLACAVLQDYFGMFIP